MFKFSIHSTVHSPPLLKVSMDLADLAYYHDFHHLAAVLSVGLICSIPEVQIYGLWWFISTFCKELTILRFDYVAGLSAF
jgi:hypothetical protein